MSEATDEKIQDDVLRQMAAEDVDQFAEVVIELDIPEQKLILGSAPGQYSKVVMGLSKRGPDDDSRTDAAFEQVLEVLSKLSSSPPVTLRAAGAVVAVLDGSGLRHVAALDSIRSIQPNRQRGGQPRPNAQGGEPHRD